jgi:hypothetical protein
MRSWLAWIAVVAATGTAAAQPAAAVAPSANELEHDVAAQLAARGLVLSSHGLALQIEHSADQWLVSLVDTATGRAAASAMIDALPAERSAALAAIARVAADLAHQVDGAEAMPPPTEADRAAARRELAELSYRRRSIRFDAISELGGLRRWVFQRGELNQDLDPTAFYHLVGRDDLARSYARRRGTMIGSYVLGVTTLALAGVLARDLDETPQCDVEPTVDGQGRCVGVRRPSPVPVVVMAGLGLTELVVGTYLMVRTQPIDEAEARSLADAYNRRLRRRSGLPDVAARPRLRDVAVLPYVAASQAGIAIAARF